MNLGLYEAVEKTIIRLIGFRQDLDELITQFGLLKITQGKFDEARILFFKGSQSNPKSVVSQLNLGKACYHLQQYDDACSALSSANILDPTNQDVWIYLVFCALEDPSKETQLQPCLRELIKLDIEDPELYQEAIQKLQSAGRAREAQLLSEKFKEKQQAASKVHRKSEDDQTRFAQDEKSYYKE